MSPKLIRCTKTAHMCIRLCQSQSHSLCAWSSSSSVIRSPLKLSHLAVANTTHSPTSQQNKWNALCLSNEPAHVLHEFHNVFGVCIISTTTLSTTRICHCMSTITFSSTTTTHEFSLTNWFQFTFEWQTRASKRRKPCSAHIAQTTATTTTTTHASTTND